jgi:AcrR family transcriptional regulator
LERVLRATSEELVDYGYVELSLERVAQRAHVNKTTIYRRWPTKQDLVIALVHSLGTPDIEEPNTGTLRKDLLVLARSMNKRLVEYHGRGLARVVAAEHENTEVAKVALAIRRRMREPWMAVLRRASENEMLRTGVDIELFVEIVVSTITLRVIKRDKRTDETFLKALIDLALFGIQPCTCRD